jgi:1-acyl-sn-glycerol-3-phosphate acyltransferase
LSTLYSIGKLTVAPIMRLAWRPRVTGLEHIPTNGPAILASNHLSVVDSSVIPAVVDRQVYYLAKQEYFQMPGLAGIVVRNILSGLNQIPVDRSGGRASLMAIDAALPVLRAGHVLGIFPEGTRSPDGRLYRGRPGVAKLALDAKSPIIPVGLIGTDRVQPIGATVPKVGVSVQMRVGPPLDLSRWDGVEVDSRVLREITQALMLAIQGLTGQEYVGRYARRPGHPETEAK